MEKRRMKSSSTLAPKRPRGRPRTGSTSIGISLTDDELARLDALCARYGANRPQIFRRLLARATGGPIDARPAKRLAVPVPPPPPKQRGRPKRRAA